MEGDAEDGRDGITDGVSTVFIREASAFESRP